MWLDLMNCQASSVCTFGVRRQRFSDIWLLKLSDGYRENILVDVDDETLIC